MLLTAQHTATGMPGPREAAACSGPESSEALALNVWSHLERIPDKEERGGPDSPSRGPTAGSGVGVLG